MANAATESRMGKLFWVGMVGLGSAMGLWAFGAVVFSLAKAGWQPGELLRQYLVAVGAIGEFETLVDFYTHIKGVEYIICLAFLGTFPAFFKYVNRTKAPAITD
ncbi:MAG: hypothetical protein AB1413_07820 [Thermodesulfobacteriota bacterium]